MRVVPWIRCRFLVLLVALGAVLTACGGGGGAAPSGTAPLISNLSYSPTSTYVSTSTLTVNGTFDFEDTDGNLSTLTLRLLDSSGATIDQLTEPVQGAAGVTSGSIQGTILASASLAGTYTFQVLVTDATNQSSNMLSGAIRVADFPWVTKQQDPIAREHAASVALGGKLYVMGGQLTATGTTPGPATNTVAVYDPIGNSWATISPMPTARMGLVAAVYNNRIYAIGGRTDGFSTSAVGTVEVFDPGTGLWTSEPAAMPNPRYFAAGAVIDSTLVGPLILVAGGESLAGVLNTVEGYNPVTGAWWGRGNMPTARSNFGLASSGGSLYAVGGYGGLITQWVSTVEIYNPLLDTWTAGAPMPTARSNLALATTTTGQLLAAGGENVNRSLDSLEQYDPAGNTWTTKTPSPSAFTRATASTLNGKLFVFGNSLTLQYDPANEIR